jgi:type III secretion protein SpaR/YscT/HrcT
MSDDYVHLFLNSSLKIYNPDVFIALLFLSLARILPIIALAPFFGAKILPHPVKVVFALCLFVIFLPVMVTNLKYEVGINSYLMFLIVKEAFIGFTMGFIISLPFFIVSNVGVIIDHQRGGASLMVNDPTIQNQSSPIGTLLNFVLIFLFFVIDGPFYMINAIATSYEILPPDQILSHNFFKSSNDFWQTEMDLLNKVMVLTAQLGAPALIVILMTDVFLGIANRLAPQVQITFLGMGLKSLLALVPLYLGWKIYNQQTIVEVYKWFDILQHSIQDFGTK